MTKTNPPASVPASSASATEPTASASDVYRVVVSFGSECCGTDRQAKDALDALVGRYPGAALGHTSALWGKEGETDECFTLAGLSPDDQKRFVDDLRKTVANHLTTVTENSTCHPGR